MDSHLPSILTLALHDLRRRRHRRSTWWSSAAPPTPGARAWTPQELVHGNFRVRVTSDCTGVSCLLQDSFLDWAPVKLYVASR